VVGASGHWGKFGAVGSGATAVDVADAGAGVMRDAES